MGQKRLPVPFLWLAVAMLAWSCWAKAEPQKYAIENVKDNVYRFTAGHYHSVFMVTSDGIIVTDPITPAAAQYLKQALAQRFQKPIKYLVYSHNHADHTLGGEVFAQAGATVVAHELAAEDMAWTKLPTAPADITFTQELTLKLGDSSVELQYHGVNNGRGSVSMRFLPANVMHVVDWIVVGRMPYKNLMGYDIHGMIRSTEAILALPDFEVFVGGHADIGNKQDVASYLDYLKALYAGVRDGMLQGQSLAQTQSSLTLSEFDHLKMYRQWLPLNIEGVYNTLMNTSYFGFRTDVPEPAE
ncbi:MBL fold metallo-hydrolase [Halioxenophilus aromaticivorans]